MPETPSPSPTLYRTTTLVSVTASATPNAKGSYTEIIAATAFAASGLWVQIDKGNVLGDQLVDIAIGAAASEVIILNNLQVFSLVTNHTSVANYYFPIQIPKNTRLSARCQGSAASGAVNVQCTLVTSPSESEVGGGIVATYGATTADSGGTSVDPGATPSTKGSYAQITASTSHRIRSLMIGIGNQANTARQAFAWQFDVAVGAGGSERIIIPDLHLRSQLKMEPSTLGPFDVDIPTATRLAVRASCSGSDATDRLFDIILYGTS